MTAEIQALEAARDLAREEALAHPNHLKLEDVRDERVDLKQRRQRRERAGRPTATLDAQIAELDELEAKLKEDAFEGVASAQSDLTVARRAAVEQEREAEAAKLADLSVAELTAERLRLTEVGRNAKRRKHLVVRALAVATARESVQELIAGMTPEQRKAVKENL